VDRRLPLSLSLLLTSLSPGCAGPTTPLGSAWVVTPAQATGAPLSSLRKLAREVAQAAELREPEPRIRLTPLHQVLHGRSTLKLVIDDPSGDLSHYDLQIRYNGIDVTASFLREASIKALPGEQRVLVEHPRIRLPASRDHSIEFAYVNSRGLVAYASYGPPDCSAFKPSEVRTLGDFSPEPWLLKSIERSSIQGGFNPAFVTALVAQESGFDVRQVSEAKALGLTQVTTVAEQEVAREHADWPRYSRLPALSVGSVRRMVTLGELNARNEWRMDPAKSVQGGVTYAHRLVERWRTPENQRLLRAVFSDVEGAEGRLVLASYHSGYSRVKDALNERGRDWLSAPELTEARWYVNRIVSYCDHFSESEDP
jgi:hypothetical protein